MEFFRQQKVETLARAAGNIHRPFRSNREFDAGIDRSRRIVEDICLERYVLALDRANGKRKQTDCKCYETFHRTFTKIIIHINLQFKPC